MAYNPKDYAIVPRKMPAEVFVAVSEAKNEWATRSGLPFDLDQQWQVALPLMTEHHEAQPEDYQAVIEKNKELVNRLRIALYGRENTQVVARLGPLVRQMEALAAMRGRPLFTENEIGEAMDHSIAVDRLRRSIDQNYES